MPVRTSRFLGLGTAAVLALGLAACSSAPEGKSASGSASDGVFPVTIEHAFGETTIDAKPKRVATVAWANHEVPLALGIVPVGMSKATWGDDDGDGVLPWVEEELTALDAETPVLFDETDGIDYEAVADTEPDVILAAYSGISEEEYETLSKIAPVVAFPEVPWGTSLEDMITLNATALGLADEGDALIDDLHVQADAALEAHPALAEAKPLFAYFDPSDVSQIGYYTAIDPRPGYLHSLGLPLPQVVEENDDTDKFNLTVSAEEGDQLADVDLFVTYGDESIIPLLQADPLLSKIPAIAEGRIAVLGDSTPLAAAANPSPLSIPWGLDEYFALLEAGLQAE